MGNFEDHVQYGYAAVGLFFITSPLYFGLMGDVSHLLSFGVLAVLGGGLAMVGAVFPDVDHHASKPYQFVRKAAYVISISVAGVGCYVMYTAYTSEIQTALAQTPVKGFETLTFIGVSGIITVAFSKLSVTVLDFIQPKHRGITHSMITGTVISISISLGAVYMLMNIQYLASTTGILAGWGFLLGFISHLYCDGIVP